MSSNRSKPSTTSTNGNSVTTGNLAKSPLADLQIKFRSQVSQLSAIFPDWTVDDLVLTLDEALGDVEIASMRILEGHAARWTETHTAKSKAEKRAEKKIASQVSSSSSPSLSSDHKVDRRSGNHRPTSGGSSRPSRPPRADRERGSGNDRRGGRGGRLPRNRPTDTSAITPSLSAHTSRDSPSCRETGPPTSNVGTRNIPSISSVNVNDSSPIPDSLNDLELLNSDAMKSTELSELPSNRDSTTKQSQSQSRQPIVGRRSPQTNCSEDTTSRSVNQSRQCSRGHRSPSPMSSVHPKSSTSVSAQLPQAPKIGWAGPSQRNTSSASSNVSATVKPKSTWAQIARAAPPIQEPIRKKSPSPNRCPSPSLSANKNESDVANLSTTASPAHPDNKVTCESSSPESEGRSPSPSPSRGRSPAPRPLSPPVIPDPVRIPSPTRSLSPSRRSPTHSSSAVSHQNRQSDITSSTRPRSPSPPPQAVQQQTQNLKQTFKSATSSPAKPTTAKSGTSSAVEGVVLPAHMAIPNLGVKFGSLHLDEASHSVTAPISSSNNHEATTEQEPSYTHEEPVKPNIATPATPASISQHPSVQSAQAAVTLPTAYNPYGYSNPGIANAATIQSQQQLQQMGVGSIDLVAATAAVANPYYPSSATISAPVSATSSGSAAQGQNANAYYGYNMIGMGAGIGGVTAGDPYSSMYGGISMDRSYYDPNKVTGATDSTGATSETSTTTGQPQSQSHHPQQSGSQQQHPAAAAAAAAVAAAAYMQPGGYPNPYGFGYHPYFMPQQFNPQAAAQYHHHPHHNPQAAAAAAAAMYGQYMSPRGANASGSSGVSMSHHGHPSAASAIMYGTTASPAAGSGGSPNASTVNSAAQSGAQSGQQTNANTGAGTVQQQSQGQNQVVKQSTGYYDDRHHQHQHNYHQHGNASTGTPGSHHHSTHHTPQQQAHVAAATMYAHHQQQQHHQYQQQQQYAAAYAASAYGHGQWAANSGTGVPNQSGSQSANNGPTGVNSTGGSGPNVNKGGYYSHNQSGNITGAQHHQSTGGQSSGNSGGQQQSSANQQTQSSGQSQYPYARQYTGWTHGN